MNDLYEAFGRNLRKLRSEVGLTQDDLAAKVGLGRTSITNIEKGRQHVSLHQVFQLADAIGVSPQQLLPTRDVKPASPKLERQLEKRLKSESIEVDEADWIRLVFGKQ